MTLAQMMFGMVAGHYVADYGLQSKFIADGKDRKSPLPDVPWYHVLFAHSMIHGGFVYWTTGSVTLGCAETAVHFLIDDMKCSKLFGWDVDQALHIACKVIWLGLWWGVPEIRAAA